MKTKRQELIAELRFALGELERPTDEYITFDISGIDFEYSPEVLDSAAMTELVPHPKDRSIRERQMEDLSNLMPLLDKGLPAIKFLKAHYEATKHLVHTP